jgi:hypothetical protein
MQATVEENDAAEIEVDDIPTDLHLLPEDRTGKTEDQ